MQAQTDAAVAAAISDYLRGRFPALAAEPLTAGTPLLEGSVIDSLGILDLMTFLGERFSFEITDQDFDPDNLETFGKLTQFVERKRS